VGLSANVPTLRFTQDGAPTIVVIGANCRSFDCALRAPLRMTIYAGACSATEIPFKNEAIPGYCTCASKVAVSMVRSCFIWTKMR
jgi:hypothetical protein